mgnify:CR=1 FL=1
MIIDHGVESVTKAEWADWKRDKVTQHLLANIMNTREELKERLAENHSATAQERDVLVGRCQEILDIVRYIVADFDFAIDPMEKSSND